MVETCQIGPVWCHASSLWKAAAVKADEIKIGSHESILYQHNNKPLMYTVWANSNLVKILSNFHSHIIHSHIIQQGGIKRKIRNPLTNQ